MLKNAKYSVDRGHIEDLVRRKVRLSKGSDEPRKQSDQSLRQLHLHTRGAPCLAYIDSNGFSNIVYRHAQLFLTLQTCGLQPARQHQSSADALQSRKDSDFTFFFDPLAVIPSSLVLLTFALGISDRSHSCIVIKVHCEIISLLYFIFSLNLCNVNIHRLSSQHLRVMVA